MASLRSAMCCSHAPGLLQVDDTSDARKRLNAGYAAAAARMSATPLDFVVFVIDDHLDNYFLNSMPTFALGAAPRYGVADEGIGGYWDGELHGSEAASTALAKGLVGRGFDLAISYDDMVLDHAVTIPFPACFLRTHRPSCRWSSTVCGRPFRRRRGSGSWVRRFGRFSLSGMRI